MSSILTVSGLTTGESNEFDIHNAATHEVGHVIGLKDLKKGYTVMLTMYYATWVGYVSKRDLGDGE